MASSHIGQESTATAARDIGQMRNSTCGGVRGRKTKVGRKLLRFLPTRLFSAPFFLSFFLLHSFCPNRHSSYGFVPRKRFKWYERALKTCFVRGKCFRWYGCRLPDGAQAVGDTFQSFVQKFARTCQVDADEAFSSFAVH